MDSNKSIDSSFDYGDAIVVKKHAPLSYKPGLSGCICGIRMIDSDEVAQQFNQKSGSELYLVEFEDGESLDIPKIHLTLKPQ